VGDLAQTPLIELLRALHAAEVSGRIDLRGGALALDRGAVVAAAAGSARGLKAFCRLGRLHEGPLRLVPGTVETPREIELDLGSLILAAIEDSLGDLPDPRSRLEIDLTPAFFTTPFTPVQQQILSLAQRGATLQQVVDGLPARDAEIVQEILRLEEIGLLTRRVPETAAQIVTDSTSDLPPDLVRACGIAVVPLSVAFGKEVFRDRVDLQPGRFYKLLAERKEHPVSSPPRREDFAPRYQEHLARGTEVVSLHLSAKLSKTFEHASAAASPGVTVLDTGQVSLGLGLLTLFAARLAARNEPAGRIAQRVREMAPRVHTLFVVDTLEYLARGGRIGKARALLGGLLRIKPILGMVDGEVAPIDRVVGGRGVRPRILELLRQRIDGKRPLVAGICHGNAPAWADALGKLVREELQVSELVEAEVGPVIGANVGPGVVGIAVFQPTDDEARWIAPL
jgi:DegV family protein with EDD domain